MSPVELASNQISPGIAGHFRGEPHDFSLVMGGPLYQLFRRTHAIDADTGIPHRRILYVAGFAWVPLLLLSVVGDLTGHVGLGSFYKDIEMHVRFLVALPMLLIAEIIVHWRLSPVVQRFVQRRIVTAEDMPRFDAAIDSAIRLRNSAMIEIGLLVLVYTFGLWLWSSRIPSTYATWYQLPGSRWHLTPAGYWYVLVSIPIVQFILLRWYLRLFIWFRFLWQVSRLKLHLVPSHPDKCAGLAFLGRALYAYGPLLFAQGAMLAGVVANRVLYQGDKLVSFKMQIAGFVVFFVFAVICPLFMFTPKMTRAKRQGLADYGQIGQDYVDRFEQKWVGHSDNDELLGAADIQSLADLGNSYSIVTDMRAVPVRLQDIVRLAGATAAPFVPLLLTVFSFEELVMRLVKILF
jgi:hypothetical protein